MKNFQLAVFALAIATFGETNAAVITFQTGESFAAAQTTAQDYRTVVDAAVSASPYGSTVLTSYDIVSNQSLFGQGATNIAYKSDILFGLSTAGQYAFRAGVDFGKGGAVFLDGLPVALNTGEMWWAHSYVNTNSVFEISQRALSAGNHTLTIYGLEGCCDGGQQVQFAANGGAFESFTAQTLAPVPEPETYAMMLAGLGMIGALARRQRQTV